MNFGALGHQNIYHLVINHINLIMHNTRRGGRGGRGLAARARANAASKLSEPAAVDVAPPLPLPPLPPTRTSPRRQMPSSKYAVAASSIAASSAIAASTPSVVVLNAAVAPPATCTSNLSRTSSLTANSRSASAAKARASLNKELNESFSSLSDDDDDNKDDGPVDDDDGSITTKKKGGGSDGDSEGGEKEVAVDEELNEDEIEDAMNLFEAGRDNYDDDESIGGGGGNDYAAQAYEFFDRLWHWMDPITLISEKNRRAVESCILIEAGQSVDESATTDDNVLHEHMRVAYTRLLRDISHERLESEAVRNEMLWQLKGGREPSFSGKTLWRQYKEVKKGVRALAAEMPGASNFHSLPSGTSLRDAMKKLICKKYAARKGAKKAYDDVTDAWDEIPVSWWLEHHSIVFILCLMVHRQSPAIINAAANAAPGPTRDEQRAASAASLAKERQVESVQRHSKQSSKQSSVDSLLEKTYKAARVEGMKGVAIKHRITAAEMKLRMMNENREFYIAAATDAAKGALELNQKIKSVIDNLPDKFEDLTGDNDDDTN